jgi:lipopolysaccharide transport system ATP-binding protein
LGRRQRQDTLRDWLADGLRAPVNRISSLVHPSKIETDGRRDKDTFWALRDVSFEVKHGEVLGIIGRNGAGKSTLLKILSRITEPTRGRAIIKGRVGSLLEVGTGFHPELTGRENIFLNGAILGMQRVEIERKFDEIVAFAEIEKFLDTPVKHYSSGMYVRLAFAVAAHLEPEILLVDEVLAVGDAAFQKKCLGKMGDVARGGRTILFVSHNMAAVQSLCDRALLFNHGELEMTGATDSVVYEYFRSQLVLGSKNAQVDSEHFELLEINVKSSDGRMPAPFMPLFVTLRVRAKHPVADIGAHILIEDETGHRILGLDSRDFKNGVKLHAQQEADIRFCIEELLLTPGPLYIHLWLKSQAEQVYDEIGLFPFMVANSSVYHVRELERQWHGMTVARASVDINPQVK